MANPLVALVGGDEFRPQAAEVDKYVIQRLGRPRVRVAILPTAAARENAPLAAENGVRHFRGLGVEAAAMMVVDKPSANDECLVTQLDGVDLVYIAGGDPRYLLDTLRGSLVWRQLSGAVEQGCALAGSSAGAMVLGETMYFRHEWTPALGLLPGICVLPHFERWGADALPDLRKSSSGFDLTLLGIDGATGCVGWGGEWEVVGPGAVTVIRSGSSEVFRSGQRIELDQTS
jgi:cyanophycinase-like exopeptidase